MSERPSRVGSAGSSADPTAARTGPSPRTASPPLDISADRIRSAVRRRMLGALTPIGLGLGLFYLVLLVSHLIQLPRPLEVRLAILTGQAMLVCLLVGAASWRRRLTERWSHAAMAVIVAAVLAEVLGTLRLMPQPMQTLPVCLLILAMGLVSLSVGLWLAVILVAAGGWLWVALRVAPGQDWERFGYFLAASIIVSAIVLATRLRYVWGLERSRLEAEDHARRLEGLVAVARDSEQRWRDMFEHSPDAVFIEDLDGRVLDANPAACELHRMSKQELIGRHVLDLVPPGHREMVRRVFPKLASGELRETEGFSLTRDGQEVPVELRVNRITYAGRPALLLHVRDMSRRLEAEEALRRSEAGLAEAQRIAHLGNWELDLASGNLSWSAEVYRIFGVKPDQFKPTREAFIRCVHPADRDTVRSAVEKAIAHHQPYSIDHRVVRPNGEQRIVHEQGEVCYDQTGRAVRLLGTVLDITERRQAEQALRLVAESVSRHIGEAFFRSLVMRLAEVLEVEYAYVNEMVDPAGPRARTLAAYENGRIVPNFEYELRGTPCLGVVEDRLCSYPRGVRDRFPEDRFLAEHRVECYCGAPMASADGRVIGHLAVAGRRPMRNHRAAESVLRIFAARAAGELQRLRDERALRRSEERHRRLAARLQALLDELEHRVRNNVASLYSLVNLYAKSSPDAATFAEAVRGKLDAMKAVHEIITAAGWGAIDLASLIRNLAHQHRGESQLLRMPRIDGPPVSVPARQAPPLAMIFQELMTNCIKHGAGREPAGSVGVRWTLDGAGDGGRSLRLIWAESHDGPVAEPAARGVGLDLIEGFARFELGGDCRFTFQSPGFRCELTCRLDAESERAAREQLATL